MKKEEEKPYCSHYKRERHEDAICWKLHPNQKPKWSKNQKGNQKTTGIVQDLGSESGDESKITVVGIKGIVPIANSSSHTSSMKCNEVSVESKRIELFHIRAIAKQTKIDTLLDSGSQVNLISEQVVKQLGLKTTPHPKPYPLGWVHDNARLHVSKQCKNRFAITSKFVDQVELDVIPLDIESSSHEE